MLGHVLWHVCGFCRPWRERTLSPRHVPPCAVAGAAPPCRGSSQWHRRGTTLLHARVGHPPLACPRCRPSKRPRGPAHPPGPPGSHRSPPACSIQQAHRYVSNRVGMCAAAAGGPPPACSMARTQACARGGAHACGRCWLGRLDTPHRLKAHTWRPKQRERRPAASRQKGAEASAGSARWIVATGRVAAAAHGHGQVCVAGSARWTSGHGCP